MILCLVEPGEPAGDKLPVSSLVELPVAGSSETV